MRKQYVPKVSFIRFAAYLPSVSRFSDAALHKRAVEIHPATKRTIAYTERSPYMISKTKSLSMTINPHQTLTHFDYVFSLKWSRNIPESHCQKNNNNKKTKKF